MTILEILNEKYSENKIIQKSLEIIKDNYTSSLNDNYELIIDEYGELNVKIPSLEKKNEFVFKEIGEYEYPLVMCMKITEMNNPEAYEFLLSKFMELYKDKLELYFKYILPFANKNVICFCNFSLLTKDAESFSINIFSSSVNL